MKKFYQECPFCHKDMRDHDITSFEVERNNELQKIELNRNVPPEHFKKWLIEQRMKFTDLINTMHESVAFRVRVGYDTHTALTNLNHWYDYIDIYDNEINSFPEYFIEPEYLLLIYREFKEYFTKEETKEIWLQRFILKSKVKCPEFKYPDNKIESKIVLCAILHAIQNNQPHKINFDKFALDKFYIKGFRGKVKFYERNLLHKFPVYLEKCNKILPV